MTAIFISYRRNDARHAAGRLVDRLGQTFRKDQLFIDVDNIAPGLDFRTEIASKVGACDVLLAIIGPGWADAKDEHGARRLDNPRDFVRIELETALARDIRVVPVLVDGAQMPNEDRLPDSLRALTYRNAVRLTHERFAADADGLSKSLQRSDAAKSSFKWAFPSRSARQTKKTPPRSENAPRLSNFNAWTLVAVFAALGFLPAGIIGLYGIGRSDSAAMSFMGMEFACYISLLYVMFRLRSLTTGRHIIMLLIPATIHVILLLLFLVAVSYVDKIAFTESVHEVPAWVLNGGLLAVPFIALLGMAIWVGRIRD